MTALRLENIHKSFGQVEVLKDISLEVDEGEFAVFVGPSGCGKSTLLRVIAGLEDASSGRIEIEGQDMGAVPPAKRGIAMVFQTYALYPHLSVKDNMALGLKQAGAPKSLIEERVQEATRMLALEPYLKRRPAELSGGQRQRVAIGRAVVREPTLFLFDEPLSNLDAALRMATRIEIANLHRSLKAAMIYVTHDQIEAMTLADKIVVLREGVVEQIGPPMELYNHPANQFVAGFLGSPSMNFIEARNGGGHTWGIRPEHIQITGNARLEGTISHIERLGADTNLLVQVSAEETVTVRLFGQYGYEIGESVGLQFEDGAIHHFDADGKTIRS